MRNDPWVLCVDDEPRVLDAIEQNLAFDYDIQTATSGAEALELLAARPGCGVIVSDMRMPGMNGAELLAEARDRYPRTTRVLLTGQASLDAAVEAVNRGGIFRFLVKPCPIDLLSEVIADSLEQYRLRNAEHDLLRGTLRGALQILIDVLAVTAPLAFNRAEMVRGSLVFAGERLGVPVGWEAELAALLARLGWISIPAPILEQYVAGHALSEEALRMLTNARQLASRLLRPVPRLGSVAQIIETMGASPSVGNPRDLPPDKRAAVLLGVALELDRRALRGDDWDKAAAEIAESVGDWVVTAFEGYDPFAEDGVAEPLAVDAHDLVVGMVVRDPVRMRNGTLVLPEGTQITPLLLARLRNFATGVGLEEPIRVRIPAKRRATIAPVLPRVPTYRVVRPTQR